MKEELLRLVTLQKYDLQILEIKDHLSGLQTEIETADARLAKAKLQVAAKEDELSQLRLKSQKIDGEIADTEERYKSNSYQLMTLKDKKSYEAMKMQMEELRNKISDRESQGLEVLNAIEEIEKILAIYGGKVGEEEARIQALKDQMEEQRQSRSDESAELTTKREAYAKQITPMMLSKYDRLLLMPDRKAIAEVIAESRTCKGCYSSITRENFESVKSMDKVVTCNRCGRILYIPALLGKAD